MRSPERLGADLRRYLVAANPNVEVDWRDVLVDLAPYVDCAQRLGVDQSSYLIALPKTSMTRLASWRGHLPAGRTSP